jgi:MFS family permease
MKGVIAKMVGRKPFKVKMVIYIMASFILGFLVGWILSYFDVFLRILRFRPSTEFFTLVATFEAMAISVAIPLSFNMASRISERYESEIITDSFTRIRRVRLLPYWVISFIILTVSSRFFISTNHFTQLAKLLSWIVLIGFITIAIWLMLFLDRLRRFITDVGYVLDGLFNEAEKSFD